MDTICKMIESRVKKYGDRKLFKYKYKGEWVEISWNEAHIMTKKLHLGFISLGIGKGDPISVLSETRWEWSLADRAIISFGGITVGIYPTSTPSQVEYILTHSESKAIVIENDNQLDKIFQIKNNLPNLKIIIVIERSARINGKDILGFNDVMRMGEELEKREPGLFDKNLNAVKPDDPMTFIYTSGTTGPPKGVILTNSNFYAVCESVAGVVPIREDDVSISFLPLAHAYQRYNDYLGLYCGVSGGFAESLDKLLVNFSEIRPTIMASVPRIFEKAYTRITSRVEQASPIQKKIFNFALSTGLKVSKLKQEKKKIPLFTRLKYSIADRLVFRKVKSVFGRRIRFMVSAGAPISKKILEFFHAFGILILEGYGLTETSAPATISTPEDFKFGTVGKLLPCVKLKIAEDGEILLKGQNIFRGYFKNPEATKEAIDSDGWFHTGDIGEIDEDSFLKITDRKKDLIVTAGGKNVAPQNIENLLKTHPIISEVMVYGDRRNYLTALITLDKEELPGFVKEHRIEFRSHEELTNNKELNDLIWDFVKEKNNELARFEQIKKFKILPQEFSQDSGELTPTLKLKRKVVTQKYKDILDSMYEETIE